ncbi:MAG: fibrobacter succinogenes major paralogous domain-containing protein [Chitinispirillales bacterium]|jgi:uncharacterized protein (TIGR02145 family)|nr:fibrobacter succinogenes major paralogous domain-containing protein [Chitinispirillales bacterium]
MKKAILFALLVSTAIFAQQKGTFTDTRDGKAYKTVKIGSQTWMAENLNFKTKESKCYSDNESNCTKYGRLYGQDASACPSGWRLPNNSDWETLVKTAGGKDVAGKKLKSTSGWNKNGNGTDEFGFSALPGGNYFEEEDDDGNSFGGFNLVGDRSFWWSATSVMPNGSFYQYMSHDDGKAGSYTVGAEGLTEFGMYSIRCIQK